MKIVLFTASTKVKAAFGPPTSRAKLRLEVRAPSELKGAPAALARGSFLYVDVGARTEAEVGKIAKLLGKRGLPFGFVDPADRIRDIALLFSLGASDFIGGRMLKKGMDAVRIRRAVESPLEARPRKGAHGGRDRGAGRGKKPARERKNHTPRKRTPDGPPGAIDPGGVDYGDIPAAGSWDEVEEGKEYLFSLMYIELDNLADLRKNLAEKNIQLTARTFREYVERWIAPHDGRLWMWNEFSGLALFPFDGGRCEAVIPCLRLMLAMRIFSADFPFLNIALSCRIALHIGGTVYRKKGDTGNIVSDALNSVFHLGRKFLKPGNFAVTNPVYVRVPECLKGCFLEAGKFEGETIMRMRLPR